MKTRAIFRALALGLAAVAAVAVVPEYRRMHL